MVAEFSKQTGGGGPPSMADYNSAISAWCECEGRVKDLQAINAELLAALEAIEGGRLDGASEMAVNGQWHQFAQALQGIARAVIAKATP